MRIDEGFLTPEAIARLQQEEALSDKTHKRTAQQIEAIYSSGQNILVSASAGSGKTFVMVERILDKILRGIPVDCLFISTFTVKAATELIERIEKKLHTAIAETQDYQLKAYLNDQLQALSQADIGTMDAFAQKLVHQHGYVLGISPHFRIIQDKAEQDILKREVFVRFLKTICRRLTIKPLYSWCRIFLDVVRIAQPLERLLIAFMPSVNQLPILAVGWQRSFYEGLRPIPALQIFQTKL